MLVGVCVRCDSRTVWLSVEVQPCQCLQVRFRAAFDELHHPAVVDVGRDELDVGCEFPEIAHVAKSHITEKRE